jgi:hypothetical protein
MYLVNVTLHLIYILIKFISFVAVCSTYTPHVNALHLLTLHSKITVPFKHYYMPKFVTHRELVGEDIRGYDIHLLWKNRLL